MKIGLDTLVISKVNDSSSQNLKGDAFEALLGAMFIDKGFKRTKKFVETRFLKKYVDLKKLQKTETNFKSKIIEWSQKNKQDISFESFEESSERSKSSPVFISHLMVLDKVLGTGKGNSKKEAEQKAAKEALSNIKNHF
jgi:ribonuclease-3